MMSGRTKASLLGERAQILVERALSEFRSGRPVLITSASDVITALPVDGMTKAMLVDFRAPGRSYCRARGHRIPPRLPTGLRGDRLKTAGVALCLRSFA